MDNMSDLPALAAGLLCKRTDGFAINLVHKTVPILGFNCGFFRLVCRDHVLRSGHPRVIRSASVKGCPVTLRSASSKATDLLTELVSRWLDELNELFSVRTAAIVARYAERG